MWRGELGAQAFQAPVDVHASADGQVYMFKRRTNENAASSEDELSAPETKLDQPGGARQGGVHLLERPVSDGDSLNKLALQYGCQVADIKRVNNLLQEQDLFALKRVRIPVQKHSFSADPPSERHGRVPPPPQEATDFVMEVDSDLDRLIVSSPHGGGDQSTPPCRFGLRRQGLGGHGSSGGVQWWNAVVAMLLIGVVLPIFYLIYFQMRGNREVSPTSIGLETTAASSHQNGTVCRAGNIKR